MTRNELVKLAYAYGASVALQEVGYNQAEAENAGIKLAEEAEEKEAPSRGIHPALLAALAGAGGIGLGAGGLAAYKNRDAIVDALRRAGSTTGNLAQQAGSTIGGAAQRAGSTIGGAAQRAGSTIGGAASSVGGKASGLLDALKSKLGKGTLQDVPLDVY